MFGQILASVAEFDIFMIMMREAAVLNKLHNKGESKSGEEKSASDKYSHKWMVKIYNISYMYSTVAYSLVVRKLEDNFYLCIYLLWE